MQNAGRRLFITDVQPVVSWALLPMAMGVTLPAPLVDELIDLLDEMAVASDAPCALRARQMGERLRDERGA